MNEIKVIKRDGSLVDFDINKIENAITKAFGFRDSEIGDIVDIITSKIEKYYQFYTSPIGVEAIQNIVEKVLMEYDPDVAKEYIIYRYQHQEDRLLDDRIHYMESYSNSSNNAATSSETDANANITTKNVSNMEGEVYKTTNRRIQRRRMKKMLTKLYDSKLASQYIEDIEHRIIYIHDEASTPTIKNYCEAVSLYPLMVDGTSTLDGLKTAPPNNLDSACGQLINCAFLLSSQCKGAVAFGEFFNYLNYYIVKEFGPNWYRKLGAITTSVHCTKQRTIKDTIEQAFQKIVFNFNQPAGNRGSQSPFTNISYYDSNYWKAMFEDFYYPDGTQPEWEAIDVLQKMFMRWFNVTRTKTLLTFPVKLKSAA